MANSFVQRFIFDKLPIKGACVVLSDVWQTVAAQKEYPEGIRQLLGELLAANILMTTNIKFNGKLITQIQGNPKLDLVVSECTNNLKVRATAKFSTSIHKDTQINYMDCITKGSLVISLDSKNEGQLYQSVVALSGFELAEVLNEYMLQSEQLPSIFILAYSTNKIVGFMLQQLPNQAESLIDEIKRVFMLANTLTKSELLSSEIITLLPKLFHEDDLVVFDPLPVKFACTCSRNKVSNMLRSLGKDEVNSIIAEQTIIKVTCDFCNTTYKYDINDAHNLFNTLWADIESISQEVH